MDKDKSQADITEWQMSGFNQFIEERLIRGAIDWRRCYFRGQANSDWGLVPSLLRYNKLPNECNSWLQFENLLLEKFKKKGYPLIEEKPTNKLDWLTIAQHNGLPTRLLDWCESPLHALFFAVENLDHQTDFAVWGYFPERTLSYEKEEIDLTQVDGSCIYLPFHLDSKITAQQGVFTVHELPDSSEEVNNEDILITSSYSLYKFTFDKSLRETIKEELDSMGINHFSLFPSLEGLARNIKWEVEMTNLEEFFHRRDMKEKFST